MKWSNRILLFMLFGLIISLLASNWILKAAYNKIDKSDIYWTYDKVLTQPFRYVKLIGGNVTNVAFEQSPHCSVRVLDDWNRNHSKLIETSIQNDTLVVKFVYKPGDMGEERWMKWTTLVRIFAPEMLHVEAINTNFAMFKLNQKTISVNLSGKSKFEIESNIHILDMLNIAERDSAEAVLEMSPDMIVSKTHGNSGTNIRSPEAMLIRSLNANLQGNTLLDVGHAQIDSLRL